MRIPPLYLRISFALAVVLQSKLPLAAQEMVARHSESFLDPENGSTESDLVKRALAQNPTFAADRQEIEMARGGVTQARLRKNPSLTAGGLREIAGQDNRVSLGGALPLELYGRRARRTEVAERRLDATREDVSDKRRLLVAEVALRFGETLAAVRNLHFSEQLLQINRDFLKLTGDRVSEGAAAPLDEDEVRVEVNRIEALRIDYQAKAEMALLRLKEAVGMQPEELLRLKGSLEIPTVSITQAELLKMALAHRPDIAEQRAKEAIALADLRQQEVEAKPDVTISASYERPNSGFSQRAFDASGVLRPIRQTFNYAVVGIDITLPAFNRNQGAIAAGTAAITSARNRIAAVDLLIRHEVARSYVRYQAAQSRVTAYKTGVRDQAARNLEVVRKVNSFGRSTLLDVITEQRRYIDIETSYTEVLLDAFTARVALEQAIGASLR